MTGSTSTAALPDGVNACSGKGLRVCRPAAEYEYLLLYASNEQQSAVHRIEHGGMKIYVKTIDMSRSSDEILAEVHELAPAPDRGLLCQSNGQARYDRAEVP